MRGGHIGAWGFPGGGAWLSSGPCWADFRPDMDLRRLIGDAWRLDGAAKMG